MFKFPGERDMEKSFDDSSKSMLSTFKQGLLASAVIALVFIGSVVYVVIYIVDHVGK